MADNSNIDDDEGKDTDEPENSENEPKNADTKQFKCVECGYIYEGEEIPEDYECPECGSTEFEEVENEPEEPEEPEDEGNNTEEPTEQAGGFF